MTIDKDLLSTIRLDAEGGGAGKNSWVRALLAEIDRLKGEVERIELISRISCNHDGYMAALTELDQLKTELAGLRTGYDAQNAVISGLKEDREELIKALGDILALYEDDEGCRSLPEYIAGRAAMAKEASQ